MHYWIIVLLTVLSVPVHATTIATERVMAWEGKPLPVTLAVGKETLIM